MARLWKIFNGIFAVMIVVTSIRNPASLKDFLVEAGALVAIVGLVDLLVIYYNFRSPRNYLFLVFPAFFLTGLEGSLAAFSAWPVKLFMGIGGAILFYLHQIHFPDLPARSNPRVFFLATTFLTLTALWSVNFFFTIPWWMVLVSSFWISLLLFWQAFYMMNISMFQSLGWGLIGALILVEITWSILFLPVHFLTAATVSFMPFYLIYILSELYFHERLTKKKVYFQITLILLVAVFGLLTSSWQP